MGTVLFRRNTGVFQGKNRSQRRETVRFGLMGFDSLLLYQNPLPPPEKPSDELPPENPDECPPSE